MTICIAAACNHTRESGPKIVLCTDWRQSSIIGRSDILHKQLWLSKNWVCLTAGTTTEINARVAKLRVGFSNHMEIDETNIVSVIQGALRDRLKEKRDEYTFGKFSESYEKIINTGKSTLPPEVFFKFVQETSKIDLGAELIIAGFIGSDDFLIETTKTGSVKLPTDFACAGEGEYLARASLLRRDYSDIRGIGAALYEVYEAKKAAERVNSVGEMTLIRVLNEDGSSTDMSHKDIKWLEGLYGQYGPKMVPILVETPDGLF